LLLAQKAYPPWRPGKHASTFQRTVAAGGGSKTGIGVDTGWVKNITPSVPVCKDLEGSNLKDRTKGNASTLTSGGRRKNRTAYPATARPP
jgi:hypothetical protein